MTFDITAQRTNHCKRFDTCHLQQPARHLQYIALMTFAVPSAIVHEDYAAPAELVAASLFPIEARVVMASSESTVHRASGRPSHDLLPHPS